MHLDLIIVSDSAMSRTCLQG
jgi:hypothetical protein